MISIIGAGPAGSYLAYLLAKKNKEVEVFEEHAKIGEPIQCSGVITPALNDLIKIKKDILVNKINRVRFYSPDNKSFEIKIPTDYVFDRSKLDRYIASLAEKAGVKFHLNSRFLEYAHLNKDELKLKFEKFTKNTNLLIGADGPRSKVAQSANLFHNRKFMTGIQARSKIKVESKNLVEIYLGYGEFGWSIPEDEYHSRIGVVSEHDPTADFNSLMKRLNAKFICYQSGMIPLYNPSVKTQTDKVFLVGDAATMCKSSTHGGIMFGMLAAKELADSIVYNKDYENLWRKKLGFDLWLHLKIRNTLKKFSDKDYNKLVQYFSQEKVNKYLSSHVRDFPSKFIFKMLATEPRLARFAAKLI